MCWITGSEVKVKGHRSQSLYRAQQARFWRQKIVDDFCNNGKEWQSFCGNIAKTRIYVLRYIEKSDQEAQNKILQSTCISVLKLRIEISRDVCMLIHLLRCVNYSWVVTQKHQKWLLSVCCRIANIGTHIPSSVAMVTLLQGNLVYTLSCSYVEL